jgi:hypothetical protein
MKNPLTLAGIEPATFRFVAQHLNHCAADIMYWTIHIVQYNGDTKSAVIKTTTLNLPAHVHVHVLRRLVCYMQHLTQYQ